MASVRLASTPHSFSPNVEESRLTEILGVKVSTRSFEDTVDLVLRWAEEPAPCGGPRYVCATSVHGLIEAHRDEDFKAILNNASIVTADGMPLVWMGRLDGQRSMERVYGPALTMAVCERTAGTRVRHFFYGGAAGVAEELARRMVSRFGGFRVAGTYCPPFRPLTDVEVDAMVSGINGSQADIVWVGLSTPKQERWIDSVRSRLTCKVLVSVGAAFDFHTGRVVQAPRWMQRTGLEWLFRLTREPRRLWRRYAYNNPMFLALAMLQITGLRRFTSH